MGEFVRLAVGEACPGIGPSGEGSILEVDESGLVLALKYERPTDKEIRAIQDGEAEFRLLVRGSVMFMCAKFGDTQWIEAPYNANLSRTDVLGALPEAPDGEGYTLTVVLAEHPSCIVRALRMFGLPTEFSRRFRRFAEDQLAAGFDAREYALDVQDACRSYRTIDLVGMSSVSCRFRR